MGEVPRREKILCSGTDPESYFTDYTFCSPLLTNVPMGNNFDVLGIFIFYYEDELTWARDLFEAFDGRLDCRFGRRIEVLLRMCEREPGSCRRRSCFIIYAS